MAISLTCINLIVPIVLIQKLYPVGLEQCLHDHVELLNGRLWYDQHLFREGAMNPKVIGDLVDEWKVFGFQATEERDDGLWFKDICIVQSTLGGSTLPCDWLTLVDDGRSAYLTGCKKSCKTEPGTGEKRH